MQNILARPAAAFALGLSLALAPAAGFADAPKPKIDFSGDMIVTGQEKEIVISMRYSVSLDKMRTEMKTGGVEMAGVRDMADGTIVLWSNQMPNMAMRIQGPTDAEIDAENTGETRRIDGISCTVWKVKQATACLTDDNIMLESEAEGMTAKMTNLQIAKQDESLFAPPPGTNVMVMPGNIEGLPDFAKGLPF